MLYSQVSSFCLCVPYRIYSYQKAYKEKLYGKHYAWFLPGGYHDMWWTKQDSHVTCTADQLYQAIEGYISTENIPLSIYKDRVTASGYVSVG